MFKDNLKLMLNHKVRFTLFLSLYIYLIIMTIQRMTSGRSTTTWEHSVDIISIIAFTLIILIIFIKPSHFIPKKDNVS